MATIIEFDIFTGLTFRREDGQLWEEQDGAVRLGWFFNNGGVKTPVVGGNWDWGWLTNRWQSDSAFQLIATQLRAGKLDRSNPDAGTNWKWLLDEVHKIPRREGGIKRGPIRF